MNGNQMKIVDAVNVSPLIPTNLPALSFLQREPSGSSIRLLAVGDIGLSGKVAVSAQKYGYEGLFDDVKAFLKSGDITFGNLEFPLASNLKIGSQFAADPASATALREIGFDILNLANNHSLEYGKPGLSSTLDAVKAAGLIPLGAGQNQTEASQLIKFNINGTSIGWLGCGRTLVDQLDSGPVYWEFDAHELLDVVKRESSSVDLLVVSIHIGLMYLDFPRPEDKILAEKLMAFGADIILMHHAHVLQGVQIANEKSVCCYNLGNFIIDWREGSVEVPVMQKQQNEGAIFVFDIDADGLWQVTALPTYIDDNCCIRWAVGQRGGEILERLSKISAALEGDFESDFQRQYIDRETGGIAKVFFFHMGNGNLKFIISLLMKVRPKHFAWLFNWVMSQLIKRNGTNA